MTDEQPTELVFKVEIKAEGEVRDKDGNLLSSSPVTLTGEFRGTEPPTPEQIEAFVQQAQAPQPTQE